MRHRIRMVTADQRPRGFGAAGEVGLPVRLDRFGFGGKARRMLIWNVMAVTF